METEKKQYKIQAPGHGILGAIARMGVFCDGKSDKETHEVVEQIIGAITKKQRVEWPDKSLRSIFNKMEKGQQRLFLQVLQDMSFAYNEMTEV